jgi:surfactin synthase thioesterase subunit
MLTDIHAKPIAVHLAGIKCFVHEGMLRAAAYVHCNTAQALQSAAEDYPGAPLFVTGHSMGGGVAALVTLLLRQPKGAPEALQVCSRLLPCSFVVLDFSC